MHAFFCVIAAVSLLDACATAAEESPAPAATAKPTAKTQPVKTAVADSADKKICKRVSVMGSNKSERVCSTRAEWDAYKAQGQESVEEYERARDDAISRGK
jgi:hypothetical protein